MRPYELTSEQRENLSTEEIIQIASELTNNDLLYCSVPITPAITLRIYLNSRAEDHGWIASELEIRNRAYMRRSIHLRIHHTWIQHAGIKGRDIGSGYLSVNDIVNIFGLDASVTWQILGVVNEGKGIEQPDWMKIPTNDPGK